MRLLILLLAIGCAHEPAGTTDTGMDSRADVTRHVQRIQCDPWQAEVITFDLFDVREAVYYELRMMVSQEYVDWYGVEGGPGFEYPYEHLQVQRFKEPNEDGHVESICVARPGEYSMVWAWSEMYVEMAN